MFSLRVGSIQFGIAATLAFLLLLAPSAAASFTITVEAAPINDPVPLGQQARTELTITIETADNMLCVADSTVKIDLSDPGQDPSLGFTSDITPRSLEIPLEMGLHGPLGAFQNSGTAEFTANIGTEVPRLHARHTFTPTATFDGTAPSSCQAAEWSEASNSASISIDLRHPPEEENGDDDAPGNGGPRNGDDGDENDSPAPGIAVLVLVGVLLARLRRRR